jgi:predicted secreted protein
MAKILPPHKRGVFVLISALAFLSRNLACPSEAQIEKAETSPMNIIAKKGSVFTIDLPCASGRGYSWQFADQRLEGRIQFIGQTFSNGPIDKDGAGGVQHFQFKAIKDGTATIKLIYVQPFRKESMKDARTRDIKVKISDDSSAK